MGLDMYLYASKKFDATHPTADQIVATADTTMAELERLSTLDPREYETGHYVGGWDHGPTDERRAYRDILAAAEMVDLATADSPNLTLAFDAGALLVSSTCLYWRKANAVHAWFVQHCQDGIDECQESPVHPEQLMALRSASASAADLYRQGDREGAAEVMAPQSGFFFGGTNIDEWWLADMDATVVGIDRVVRAAATTPGAVDFAYHSSW